MAGAIRLIESLFDNDRIDMLLACGGMGAVDLLRGATLPSIRKVRKVILFELANNASIQERFLVAGQLAPHRQRAPTHAACYACAGRVERQDRGVNRVEPRHHPTWYRGEWAVLIEIFAHTWRESLSERSRIHVRQQVMFGGDFARRAVIDDASILHSCIFTGEHRRLMRGACRSAMRTEL